MFWKNLSSNVPKICLCDDFKSYCIVLILGYFYLNFRNNTRIYHTEYVQCFNEKNYILKQGIEVMILCYHVYTKSFVIKL